MQSDRPRQRRQVKSPGVLPLQVQDSPQISPTPPPIPDPNPPRRNRSSPPPSFPHNAPSSSSRSALSSCARPPGPPSHELKCTTFLSKQPKQPMSSYAALSPLSHRMRHHILPSCCQELCTHVVCTAVYVFYCTKTNPLCCVCLVLLYYMHHPSVKLPNIF